VSDQNGPGLPASKEIWSFLKDNAPGVAIAVAMVLLVLAMMFGSDAQGIDPLRVLAYGAVFLGLIAAAAIIAHFVRRPAAFGRWAKATSIAVVSAPAALVGVYLLLLGIALAVPGNNLTPPAICLQQFTFGDACRELQNSPAVDKRVAQSSEVSAPIRPLVAGARDPAFQSFAVYIQFAGYTRDAIKQLNAELRQAGWRVEGTSGERTDKATGLSEVRYHGPGQRAAAEALATDIGASLGRSVVAREVTIVHPDVLEAWIGL